MTTYEFLCHVTLIINILQKLTQLIRLVTIRKSVFSDAHAVSAGCPAKASVLPTSSTGKESKRA